MSVPDLINVLNLDVKLSKSPYYGQHRTFLIAKDYTNVGDFAFNNLLQHYSRKEPNTPILLVTLNQSWSNYSACAAKCGYNVRRSHNSGNIDILDVMAEYLNEGTERFEPAGMCNFIFGAICDFTQKYAPETDEAGNRVAKPVIIMIDDFSVMRSLEACPRTLYRMFVKIDKLLRDRSRDIKGVGQASHLIVQTMTTYLKPNESYEDMKDDLSYLTANLASLCDIAITIMPLESGYSTRIDGIIRIVDNRLPTTEPKPTSKSSMKLPTSLFADLQGEIGLKRAYFFKLGDRRAKLTSSALLY